MMTQEKTGINKSGLHPLGRAVLLQSYEPKKGSIYIPPTISERSLMIETRAIVLEIGPDAWKDETRSAKVGDKVLIARMSWAIADGPLDGKQYRIVNCNDIFCGLEDET